MAAANGIAEVRRFALGLHSDAAAVYAGLSLRYSNGQTEGQINKLKLVKRAMYGRGKFDLLRQRVLHAARSTASRERRSQRHVANSTQRFDDFVIAEMAARAPRSHLMPIAAHWVHAPATCLVVALMRLVMAIIRTRAASPCSS